MYNKLEVDKKSYPIKFGYASMYEWEENGGDRQKLETGEVSLKEMFELYHYALIEGHELADEKYDGDIKDTIRLFDADPKAFDRATKLLNNSFPKQKTKEA